METPDYLRFVLALIFVLGLFGTLVLVARRYGLGSRLAGPPGGAKRLRLVEVMSLDAKRRLVLLRRDEVEHLVILGPHGETVVEGSIAGAHADFAGHLAAETAARASKETEA